MALLERAGECAAIDAVATDVSGGGSGLIVLEGPSGIGKSSLLARLVARAEEGGVRVCSLQATRLGRDVPFGLARRLLEPMLGADRSALGSGWARRARPLFDGELGGAGVTGPLVEGLIALVASLRRALGPMILAVDEVQWADRPSLEFLTELAERRAELGVALAVAMQTGVIDVDEAPLQRLRALSGARILKPTPLSVSAVRELVRARRPEADEAFSERLGSASGGNPLLVTELLAEAGRRGDSDLRVGDGVARTLLLSFEGLDSDARALCDAVAVLGTAPLRRAATLATLAPARADAAADQLVARHILAADEPVRFSQPIVAEALLTTLPPFKRASMNRRAAELLAADGEEVDRVAAYLMHARPAADAWACEVLRTAARVALARGEPQTAASLLTRAAAEPAPPCERGDLLVELARAQAAGGLPAAIEAFQRALKHIGDAGRRAEAWHGLSRLLYVRGDNAGAAAAGAHGAAELPEGDPRRQRLLADELAGAILIPERSADAAARTEALIAAEPPSDPALLAQLIVHQAWRGIHVERLPELAAAAVASDPLVDVESGGFALSFVAGALNMVDQTPLACELLHAGLERVSERGDPLAEVSLRCCRAWARIYQGQIDLAGRDLDAVLAINQPGWPMVDGLCGPPLVVLRLERGDIVGAQEALRRTPPTIHNPGLAWFAGAVALAGGDAATALTAFQAAGTELEGLGVANPAVLPWRSGAALAAVQLGQRADAQALANAELAQAQSVGVPRALGIALRTAGFAGDDPLRLKDSVDVLEHSPARLEHARSLLFLGIVHRRARRLREARPPLTGALDLAEECGSIALAHRAHTELTAAGARSRRGPRRGLDALTASERKVAELAAEGHTTRQIAATLYLAPKTVEGHLTRAFRKLRVTSRTEIGSVFEREQN